MLSPTFWTGPNKKTPRFRRVFLALSLSLANDFGEVRASLASVEVRKDELNGANRLEVDVYDKRVVINDVRRVVLFVALEQVVIQTAVINAVVVERLEGVADALAGVGRVRLTDEPAERLDRLSLQVEEETADIQAVKRRVLVLHRLLTPDDESAIVEVADGVESGLVEVVALTLIWTERDVRNRRKHAIVETERSPPHKVLGIRLAHNLCREWRHREPDEVGKRVVILLDPVHVGAGVGRVRRFVEVLERMVHIKGEHPILLRGRLRVFAVDEEEARRVANEDAVLARLAAEHIKLREDGVDAVLDCTGNAVVEEVVGSEGSQNLLHSLGDVSRIVELLGVVAGVVVVQNLCLVLGVLLHRLSDAIGVSPDGRKSTVNKDVYVSFKNGVNQEKSVVNLRREVSDVLVQIVL